MPGRDSIPLFESNFHGWGAGCVWRESKSELVTGVEWSRVNRKDEVAASDKQLRLSLLIT